MSTFYFWQYFCIYPENNLYLQFLLRIKISFIALVRYLGPVKTDKDIERYRKTLALEKRKANIERADLRELNVLPHKNFGMIYCAEMISSPLRSAFDILGKYRDIIFLNAVSRLTDPSSDIDLIRYLEGSYYPQIQDLKKDFPLTAFPILSLVTGYYMQVYTHSHVYTW